MPPRKSTASNPPDEGGAETTPVSKGKQDDSIGVEVCQSHRKPLLMVTDESFPGSQPPQINDRSPRERGVASKHTDTEGCFACITQECNRFCELHRFEVRPTSRTREMRLTTIASACLGSCSCSLTQTHMLTATSAPTTSHTSVARRPYRHKTSCQHSKTPSSKASCHVWKPN